MLLKLIKPYTFQTTITYSFGNWIFLLSVLAVGCSPTQRTESPSAPDHSESQRVWFESRTLDSSHHAAFSTGHQPNQYSLLETVGGGSAMLDVDLDGDLDLYLAGGGTLASGSPEGIRGNPGRFYQQCGLMEFVDRTLLMRVDDHGSIYSHGVHAWDFDQDGFSDLVVTGYGGQLLLHNMGDGTFENCTRTSGMNIAGWSTASASGDFNNDNLPDLYVARYCKWTLDEESQTPCGDPSRTMRDSCPPQAFAAEPDLLFLSNGDGTFSNGSDRLITSGAGRGLGVLAADLNADGKVDLYVANDAGPNHLFLNTAASTWLDEALLAGVSGNEFGIAEGSMGIASGDIDGDLQIDLFVTNFELENNSLYLSVTPGLFRHATAAVGLGGAGFQYVGFGTAISDFNNDGWQDLMIVNGNVFYHTGQTPYLQPALLYKNMQGRFVDHTTGGGEFFRGKHAARGLATGDLDNDGTLDFLVVDQEVPATVGVGQIPPTNWIRVELKCRTSSNPPIGARVVHQYSERTWARWCSGGNGYLSSSDPRFLLPVDSSLETAEVTVDWPSGLSEKYSRLPVRKSNVLVEGNGVPVPKERNGEANDQAEQIR
jgi:enediyne biosynthesis protein E4